MSKLVTVSPYADSTIILHQFRNRIKKETYIKHVRKLFVDTTSDETKLACQAVLYDLMIEEGEEPHHIEYIVCNNKKYHVDKISYTSWMHECKEHLGWTACVVFDKGVDITDQDILIWSLTGNSLCFIDSHIFKLERKATNMHMAFNNGVWRNLCEMVSDYSLLVNDPRISITIGDFGCDLDELPKIASE